MNFYVYFGLSSETGDQQWPYTVDSLIHQTSQSFVELEVHLSPTKLAVKAILETKVRSRVKGRNNA